MDNGFLKWTFERGDSKKLIWPLYHDHWSWPSIFFIHLEWSMSTHHFFVQHKNCIEFLFRLLNTLNFYLCYFFLGLWIPIFAMYLQLEVSFSFFRSFIKRFGKKLDWWSELFSNLYCLFFSASFFFSFLGGPFFSAFSMLNSFFYCPL